MSRRLKNQKRIQLRNIHVVVGNFCLSCICDQPYKIKSLFKGRHIIVDGTFVFFQSQAVKQGIPRAIFRWNRRQKIIDLLIIGYMLGNISHSLPPALKPGISTKEACCAL